MADFRQTFQAPSPTVQTGVRKVTDILSERIKIDVSDEIFQYDPNANSLTLLTTKLRKKRKVTQYLFHWIEKDRLPRTTKLTAAATAADTSISVEDGSIAQANSLAANTRTGEVFIIGGQTSTSFTSLTRGIGDSALPMDNGDTIEVIGSAYPEYGSVGTPLHTKERLVSNRCQIFRTPFSFTGRDQNTDMFGGRDPNTERRWQGVEHAISIERAFWWGRGGQTTDAGDGVVTTLSGVDELVGDNVWDVNAIPFTERSVIEWLEFAMRFGRGGKQGSRSKFLFGPPRLLTEFESWAKDRLEYRPTDKSFGIDIVEYRSAHGRVRLISHPLFEERGDVAFLLDLNHLRYVFHQGRDTQLLRNRGDRGRDGETEEYLSDVSLMVEFSSAHGKIRNIPL